MINFDILERNQVMMRDEFLKNSPFEHIIIDNFCNDTINFFPYRSSMFCPKFEVNTQYAASINLNNHNR